MKILFVCSNNDQRSTYAEKYFSKKHPDYDFKSAGTNYKKCEKLKTQKLTDELLVWADKIFVMQQHHHNMIRKYGTIQCDEKVTVLDIPDDYTNQNEKLKELLDQRVNF